MDKFLAAVLFLVSILAFKSCDQRDREIRHLKSDLSDVKYEKREVWMDSCMHSVEWSCYYSDCARISIEELQSKICKLPEDM